MLEMVLLLTTTSIKVDGVIWRPLKSGRQSNGFFSSRYHQWYIQGRRPQLRRLFRRSRPSITLWIDQIWDHDEFGKNEKCLLRQGKGCHQVGLMKFGQMKLAKATEKTVGWRRIYEFTFEN